MSRIGFIGFLTALALAPGLALAQGVTVTDAWARATPGNAPTGAVYMTVTNAGGAPDTLLSAKVPVAKTAELHSMNMTNGVMQMRPTGPIALAPGQSLAFQPGGYHVMLIGLTHPLKEGETFPLTLTFAKAGKVTVSVQVAGIGAMQMPMGH